MNIQSSLQKDIRTLKTGAGAYEWWYFDAISNDGTTKAVIIFYEGNPFSRRYINRQQQGKAPQAANFPAISISLYKNGKPVYYSFTEVKREEAVFGSHHPLVQIAKHKMEGKQKDSTIKYTLHLNEELPSGDSIKAELLFESENEIQLAERVGNNACSHQWNVCQPRANVTGVIRCKGHNTKENAINFEGRGYHDHNKGPEPLKRQFKDWLWGRFHFNNATFIYYIKGSEKTSSGAWIIDNRGGIVTRFNDVHQKDPSRSLFGLRSARKLIFDNTEAKVLVQQTQLVDNGPFYQRFGSDAFLHIPKLKLMESSRGITEYLCPPRIYNRLYWPLTNMRIRYKKEKPHWVQRSKRLYRWTW